jgi:mannose-1-phosphate guanylyltransferase/mannose-6-phosphate isomerase
MLHSLANTIVPVILSGGAGSRLWPISREGHPKPFMKLADGESLIRKTYQRAASLNPSGQVVTVTNRDYYFMSKDQWEEAGFSGSCRHDFLLEPQGRNTAPAIAMAAFYVAQEFGADATMLVLAADHLIQDHLAFLSAVKSAVEVSSQGYLVTFGIVAKAPETGFGYIQAGNKLEGLDGFKVARFVEKPSLEKAQAYLTSGDYYWNSGMFCFQAGTILRELEQHAPEVYQRARECWQTMQLPTVQGMVEISKESFKTVPDISIDYAVMEKSDMVAVVPGDFGWSDIGAWDAISELTEPDASGNRVNGDAILIGSTNNFVHSEHRLIAGVGLEDLMIIDADDALLVAHRDKAQEVKQIVQQLKARDHESVKLHRTVFRPWGTYTVLETGRNFKIKRIVVKPGGRLSLQMHYHRSEHWVVVSGMAKVTNGDRELYVNTNESTYIPAGHRHRLENPGLVDLVMIEVQSGDYLDEDDIVRFEDTYGRS